MDPQAESITHQTNRLKTMQMTGMFWMIFNCPELHGYIFKDMSKYELKKLMLVNRSFAHSLRPLVWKTLKFSRARSVPTTTDLIKNAALVRNLSTTSRFVVQTLADSGNCNHLESLIVADTTHPTRVSASNSGSVNPYLWKLVRLNLQLKRFLYSPELGNMDFRRWYPSKFMIWEMTTSQDMRRSFLVEISLTMVVFGQDHLKSLADLCPNLSVLSVEYCAYTKNTEPFGGDQLWGPKRISSFTATPLRQFNGAPFSEQTNLGIHFRNERSILERLELNTCGKSLLKALQQCLTADMTSLQRLLPTAESNDFVQGVDDDMKAVIDTTACCPGLKNILCTKMVLGPLSLGSLVRMHAQSLTVLQLLDCEGIQGDIIEQILVHCTNLQEIQVLGSPNGVNFRATEEWGCNDLSIFQMGLVVLEPNLLLRQLSRLLELKVILMSIRVSCFDDDDPFLQSLMVLKSCTKIESMGLEGVPHHEKNAIVEWVNKVWPNAQASISGNQRSVGTDDEDEGNNNEYGETGIFSDDSDDSIEEYNDEY